jgi:hypothetical protein
MFVLLKCQVELNLVQVIEIAFVVLGIQVIPSEHVDFVVIETYAWGESGLDEVLGEVMTLEPTLTFNKV